MPNKNIDLILDRMAVNPRAYPGVYYVGARANRLTFLSQQQRALNLVWALSQTNQLGPGKKVAIIGGGLAGMTAYVAARRQKADVTLFERKENILHLQRGSRLRYVHPHIFDWPAEGAETHLTDLPCMNWGAGIAHDIADTILRQLEQEGIKEEDCKLGQEIQAIRYLGDRRPIVCLDGKDHIQSVFDIVILSIGFGLERTHTSVPFVSYWENDNFSRAVLSGTEKHRFLVSGCGDGGLIDAIRLVYVDFDHAAFTQEMLRNTDLDLVKKRLLEIDSEVTHLIRNNRAIQNQVDFRVKQALKNGTAASDEKRLRASIEEELQGLQLYQEYEAMVATSLPPVFLSRLDRRIRHDRIVYLNGTHVSPLTLRAQIFNRFVVFLLLRQGHLHYRAGRLQIPRTVYGEPFKLGLERPGFPTEELTVDTVVLRHGAVSELGRLFSRDILDDLQFSGANDEDQTRLPLYDGTFLKGKEFPDSRLQVRLDYAVANTPLAAKWCLPDDAGADAGVRVEVKNEEVYYVVTGVPPKASTFMGIPVRFEAPVQDVSSPTTSGALIGAMDVDTGGVTTVPAGKRVSDPGRTRRPSARQITLPENVLLCGSAINLQDAPVEHGGGSLGCFVLTAAGEPAILTSALAALPLARLNDVVTHTYPMPASRGRRTAVEISDPVADVTQVTISNPSSPNASMASNSIWQNKSDGLVAVLRPGIQYRPNYGPAFPTLPVLRGPGVPLSGQRVFKVGRGSGLTWGTIARTGRLSKIWSGSENIYWFDDQFIVVSVHEQPFAQAGDSGAAIVSEEGDILGLILGGTTRRAIVCPIQPILSYFDCSLLLETPPE